MTAGPETPADLPATAAPGAPEDGWQRLDRRSIWVEAVLPGLGTLATSVLISLLSGWGGRGWDLTGWIAPGVGALVVVGIVAVSVWAWVTTTYRVTATHVELSHGLLVRKARSVARDRLRAVDLTADVVHRLAGVAVAAIGTGRQGGESDDTLTLRSVSAAEGERLRAVLLDRGPRASAPSVDAETAASPDTGAPAAMGDDDLPMARFAGGWVRLAPFSLLGLVAVGGVGAVVGQFSEVIDWPALVASGPSRELFAFVLGLPLLPAILVGLVGLAALNSVLSTVLYVVLYGGFTLVRAADSTLRLSYGLLTRRSVSIEEARIRGVRVDEPLLLRLGGGAKAKVVAAGLGGRSARGEQRRDGDLLLPPVPVALAHRVTAQVLRTPATPVTAALHPHPPAALRVLLVRWVPLSALPAVGLGVPAVLTGFFPDWPGQAALVFVVAGVAGALLSFVNLGHARAGEYLVIRSGSGVRRTAAVRCDGVIAWRFRRSLLLRRSRLLSASAAVAAGSGAHTIHLASQDDALAVAADAVPGWLDPFLEPDPRGQA